MSFSIGQARSRSDRPVVSLVLLLLIALAWLGLAVVGMSPHGRFLDHTVLTDQATGFDPLVLLIAVGGWVLMVTAMMLPTVLPLVTLFRRLVQRRPDRERLVVCLLAGYLGVWTGFGVAVHLLDVGLHRLVGQVGWLDANSWAIAAATLIAAGLFQYSPLKYHCLEKCRSPFSFITQYWRGRHEAALAFRLGAHHGLFCVGCCWALMLVMFAVGVGNLGWMLALAAVMAVEKNFPWGRRLSVPVGVVFLVWGISLVVLGLRGGPA